MDLITQIKKLYEQLDSELDHIPAGEKFYSIQEIISRFHTNRRVVDGTLERMEKKELIRRIPRVGCFSRVNRCEKKYRILLLRVDWPSAFNSYYVRRVTATLTETGRYRVTEKSYRYDQPIFSRRNLDDFDCVIFLRDASMLSMAELRIISSLKIPVVQLDSNCSGLEISSLSSDHYQGGMAAAECLIRHGHRDLLLLNAEPFGENTISRINGFRTRAELAGANVIELEAGTHHGEEPNQRCYQALVDYLDQHGKNFSAICFTTIYNGIAGYAALQDRKLRIPEDVSVIAIGGHEETGIFFRPAITTVVNDFDALMQALVKGLDGLLKKKAVFHTLIPFSIQEQDSVRDFKSIKSNKEKK